MYFVFYAIYFFNVLDTRIYHRRVKYSTIDYISLNIEFIYLYFFYLCWLHIHKRSRLTALFDWSCSNSTCWSFTAHFLYTANKIAGLSNVTHSARETKHSQNIECMNLYSSKNNIIKHLFIPQQFINLLKKFNKYYLNI